MIVKETVKKLLVGSLAAFAWTNIYANTLDSKSAKVSLEVGKFAEISLLNDFSLSPLGQDGAAKAMYEGADEFRVKSNCPVNVSVSGVDLSNGTYKIQTTYKLDGADDFMTKGPHNEMHKISAQATLGDISEQEAGGYSSQITITVSAI